MTDIILADMDAWEEFSQANREALEQDYESISNAFRHAIDGGLIIGGGAAPAFFVSFDI